MPCSDMHEHSVFTKITKCCIIHISTRSVMENKQVHFFVYSLSFNSIHNNQCNVCLSEMGVLWMIPLCSLNTDDRPDSTAPPCGQRTQHTQSKTCVSGLEWRHRHQEENIQAHLSLRDIEATFMAAALRDRVSQWRTTVGHLKSI